MSVRPSTALKATVINVGRILAVDYGEKRIGIAISDELQITASPLMTLLRNSDDGVIAQIVRLAERYSVETIVIGLPVRTDSKEGEMERRVRSFAEKLQSKTKVPVVLFDERFTTRIAEQVLLEADLSRQKRKRVRDKLAAVVLLQSYLETRRGT
ncbi:MAG: Holliday junction resolvase RuvX [Armatimonadetes bacterium]|nr:Holliday junction resolvase RuvX [Armatimonadota bacterium]MCX7968167.1 Holliday junction resolvase RuvX [Armatimonadota bacterium]MDW8144351.1 Holliday junction resolvase RuvX [Armatimonadota bacterium]